MFTPLERLNANGRDNNFNLLRVIAALSVVVSHAFPLILGKGAPEPLASLWPGCDLSKLGLWTFFIISGFFVSQSFAKHNLVEFIVARILRIYPGLIVALVFAAFVIGPLCSSFLLGQYMATAYPYNYVVKGLFLRDTFKYELPGVFTGNPYPYMINGPLWTLYYEVLCYGMVMAVGLVSCRRVLGFTVFLGFYLAGYFYLSWLNMSQDFFAHNPRMQDLHELTLPFVAGMAYYQFRRIIPYSGFLAGFALLVLIMIYSLTHFVLIVLWSYIVMYAGFYPSKWLQNYNKIGDYSYGVYIYGWPVEQALEYFYNIREPLELMGLAVPITLLIAMASWDWIEKPALGMRARIVEFCLAQCHRPSRTAT